MDNSSSSTVLFSTVDPTTTASTSLSSSLNSTEAVTRNTSFIRSVAFSMVTKFTTKAVYIASGAAQNQTVIDAEKEQRAQEFVIPPHKSPLVWALAIQILCSVILIFLAQHLYRKVRKNYRRRVATLDRQLRRMETRLRMQQPNINLISQIAHKCNIPLDEENGEKTRMIMLVAPAMEAANNNTGAQGDNSSTKMLPQPEKTQLSSQRKLRNKNSNKV